MNVPSGLNSAQSTQYLSSGYPWLHVTEEESESQLDLITYPGLQLLITSCSHIPAMLLYHRWISKGGLGRKRGHNRAVRGGLWEERVLIQMAASGSGEGLSYFYVCSSVPPQTRLSHLGCKENTPLLVRCPFGHF